MIEFITLLLGLTIGNGTVEVAVARPVAAVELRLDGRTVERRSAPPWRFECDFGQELRPHRLEAIAVDAEGRELGRARQWVNYARANRAAVIVLEPGAQGPPRSGRVVWAAAGRVEPEAIEAAFDGRALAVDASGRFQLPPYSLGELHHLSATVTFSAERLVTADSIFGGAYGDRTTSALTAVPLLVPEGKLPPPAELQPWLAAAGGPAKVFSTETGGATVVIVRDQHVDPNLAELLRRKPKQVYSRAGKVLREGDTVFFNLTFPLPRDPKGLFRALPVEPADARAGLWWLLTVRHPRLARPIQQRLWWSLALAGKKVSDAKNPRAVVLVVSRKPKDAGELGFAQARDFLRILRVPLFVWAPEEKTFTRLGVKPPEQSYTGVDGMFELFSALQASLATQRMAWIEGEYLPHEITLTAAAPAGVRLAE